MDIYQHNREQLFEAIRKLAKGNLILFRQVGHSNLPDSLIAAIPCANRKDTYLRIGMQDKLPGWDEDALEVTDWEKLLQEVTQWIYQMQEIADNTTPPNYEDQKTPQFITDKSATPKIFWIQWITEDQSYSNASGSISMRKSQLIAPTKLVKRSALLAQIAEAEKNLRFATAKEQQAKAALESAEQELTLATAKTMELQHQLQTLETED